MNKKSDNKIICFFGIIVLLFFGIFMKFNFSVDTYLLFASQNMGYIHEYTRSGRLFTSLLFRIFQFLKLKPDVMYIASFMIAIIASTFSIYILFKVFKKYIKNEIIAGIISIMIVINPFVVELWLFVEMSIMMLSILASIIAFKNFDEYLENNEKKYLKYSILWMIVALFSYQGTVGVFVSLATLTILIHSKNIKQFIKNNILSMVCYGVPTIINFGVVMLIGNDRVGASHNYLETFHFIIMASKEQLFSGFGLYPILLFKVLHWISVLLIVWLIIASKENTSKKIRTILKLVYVVFMVYFFTIITIIPQDVNSAVMFPRNSYAFGSMIGIIFAFYMFFLNKEDNKNKIDKFIILISMIVLIMELVQFTKIGINRYIVNYMDKYIVLEIQEKMNQYEKETGYKIENLAVYNIENSQIFYPDIQDRINVSAKNEPLNAMALLVFYTKRELKEAETSNFIYQKYFKGNEWNLFDLDQIVFEENTMHWYLY